MYRALAGKVDSTTGEVHATLVVVVALLYGTKPTIRTFAKLESVQEAARDSEPPQPMQPSQPVQALICFKSLDLILWSTVNSRFL